MSITVTKENGRTKIRGSETFPNGMTMTFLGRNEHMPNCVRLLDMKHARSWLGKDKQS